MIKNPRIEIRTVKNVTVESGEKLEYALQSMIETLIDLYSEAGSPKSIYHDS